MKPFNVFVISLVVLVSNISLFAQGTVTFNNGSSINAGAGARVLLLEGIPGGTMTPGGYAPTGVVWKAQLYSAAGNVTDASALTPAGVPVLFRTGTLGGFVEARSTQSNPFDNGNTINDQVAVTSIPGGAATVQLRVWDASFASYENALSSGGIFGASPILFLSQTGIGGAGGTPGVFLNGLQGFPIPVPEPSTLALGALGLAALLFRRCK